MVGLKNRFRVSVKTEHVANAAAAWWVLFAGVSFYWAAGGTIGLSTFGEELHSYTGELWFTALVFATGVMKLVPAALVLSLDSPRAARVPPAARLVAVGGLGVLSMAYGGQSVAVKLLVLAGIHSPGEYDTTAFWGHLLVWDPVWMVGGLLLLVAAWTSHNDGMAAA